MRVRAIGKFPICVAGMFLAGTWMGGGSAAAVEDLNTVGALHAPLAEHVEQLTFTNLVIRGQHHEAFLELFELGDELFGTPFNALDGGGANVGQGQRFTRTPRADLRGAGEWATHVPKRPTGPNAQTCIECHLTPDEDGAGPAAGNVSRDPFHTGSPGSFINRNTPHLFGVGAVQRLAEQMSGELQTIRSAAVAEARRRGGDVRKALQTRGGIDFGVIVAHANGSVDTTGVRGVNPDLVVRPFQWKGTEATIRKFIRDASNNELGMQAVELVGDNQDGDYDGVANELTIGDLTAMTVYNAAQPRPTTRTELASLGLIPALTTAERAAIVNGDAVFEATGCATCHVESMLINNPKFSEPSQNPDYRDTVFPGGQNPVTRGVNPEAAVSFDLTRDQPDNQIVDASGRLKARLGAFEKDRQGRAVVRLFGDLKRHDMGLGLAESIDEEGTGASVFLTENLWGVGSTAPYLHDGRATTLTEAILAHGGEAEGARSAFQSLSSKEQRDVIAFLDNLVLFKLEAEASTPNSRDDPARPRHSRHR